MNKIIWYRHMFYRNYCFVTIDNASYAVGAHGSVIPDKNDYYRIDAIDEKEILELYEYKILKRHVLKLTSNLYQELIK